MHLNIEGTITRLTQELVFSRNPKWISVPCFVSMIALLRGDRGLIMANVTRIAECITYRLQNKSACPKYLETNALFSKFPSCTLAYFASLVVIFHFPLRVHVQTSSFLIVFFIKRIQKSPISCICPLWVTKYSTAC